MSVQLSIPLFSTPLFTTFCCCGCCLWDSYHKSGVLKASFMRPQATLIPLLIPLPIYLCGEVDNLKLLMGTYTHGQIQAYISPPTTTPPQPVTDSSHPHPRLPSHCVLCCWPDSFKFLSGTFTDYSWPDEPGSWTGMDGETYDVVLSLQQDEVRELAVGSALICRVWELLPGFVTYYQHLVGMGTVAYSNCTAKT